jgi:hypothetical protein
MAAGTVEPATQRVGEMMPRISSFHGVDIYMYYNDHLPPHFHAMYGDDEALISFNPAQLYRGTLAAKILKLVLQWAGLHPTELDDNWQRARTGQALQPIAPLP